MASAVKQAYQRPCWRRWIGDGDDTQPQRTRRRAAGGGSDFAVGVKLNGVSESRDENLRFSSGTEARAHQLEVLYYP